MLTKSNQKVTADMVLRQLAKRHTGRLSTPDDIFLTQVKNGRSWGLKGTLLIMDALAIRKSWSKPCFTGYEVKVDRGDFLRDQKWPGYMECCNEMYFACPSGLIQPDELPKEVGLIWFNPEKESLFTKRKALYRPIEIPYDMLMYLVMNRIGSENNHPFFSNKREYFEALRADKAERRDLGRYVAGQTGQMIQELREENDTLKIDLKWAQRDVKKYEKLREALLAHGIRLYNNPVLELEKALSSSMSPGVVDKIEELNRVTAQLTKLVQPTKQVV